jgi:hypothetical protein
VDVRTSALDAFLSEVDARHADRVWATGCDSWYLSSGHNTTLWPGSTARYLWRTRRFDPDAYRPA